MKKQFNPNDFDVDLKVADVLEKFPQLRDVDYSLVSLADEVTKYNYEVIAPEYEDLRYSSIEDYLDIDVDTIV